MGVSFDNSKAERDQLVPCSGPVEMAITVGRAKIGVTLLGFIGIVLLVIGIVALSVMPSILKAKLQENLALAEGKDAYEKWKNTPIPIKFSVYLFNITNPEAVSKYGHKPQVEEIGPYVFSQLRSKDVLEWDDENKTVTYNDLKQYHFHSDLSANMSNIIHTINLPMQGIISFVKKLGYISQSLVIPGLESMFSHYNERLLINRTAEELLFQGYKVDLVQDLLDLLRPFADVPEVLPNNTFGFLYGKNNSGDGVFTIRTGEDDFSKYLQIVRWNDQTHIPYWKDRYCNMLNGTDGSQFPPPIHKRDVLYAYTPELCRSVFLEYEQEVYVRGVPAYRFITPERLFANAIDNPNNMCYCIEPKYCGLSGILDISPCRKGLKIAVTLPHFFLTHPFVAEGVEGLAPNKEFHETFVDIEPNTGVVLRASRKLQMNYVLQKYTQIAQTAHAPYSVVPLLWVSEEAEIDDAVAELLTSKIRTPITIAKSVLTACIVLGLLWIATAGFVTVYILIKHQKTAKEVLKNKYSVVPQKPEDIIEKNEKFAPVNT